MKASRNMDGEIPKKMRTITATEAARNFSHLLDLMERGDEEIIITRNRHAVARLLPGGARMTALEAFSDLYRTIDDKDGEAWLKDMETMDRPLTEELRDPWAS